MSVSYRRYVAYSRIDDYLKAGWIVIGPAGSNHSYYSVIMAWKEEGPPVEPT